MAWPISLSSMHVDPLKELQALTEKQGFVALRPTCTLSTKPQKDSSPEKVISSVYYSPHWGFRLW